MDSYASSRSSAYPSTDQYINYRTDQHTQGALSRQPDPWQAPLDPTIVAELNTFEFIFEPTPLPWEGWYAVGHTEPILSMLNQETVEAERPSSRSTNSSTDNDSDQSYVPSHSPSPECVVLPAASTPASSESSQRHPRQRSTSASSYPFADVGADVDAAMHNLLQYVNDHKGEEVPPELFLALLERQFYPPGTEGRGARDGPEGYRCRWSNCTKVLTRRDHARDHVGTHVDYKPYGCPKCTRRFLRLYDQTRHGKKCQIRRVEVRESCKAIDLFSFTRRFQNGACSKDSLTPPFSSLDPLVTFEYIRAIFIENVTWPPHGCYKMMFLQKILSSLLFESSRTMVNPVTVRFLDWLFNTRGRWLEYPLDQVSCIVYKSHLALYCGVLLLFCFLPVQNYVGLSDIAQRGASGGALSHLESLTPVDILLCEILTDSVYYSWGPIREDQGPYFQTWHTNSFCHCCVGHTDH